MGDGVAGGRDLAYPLRILRGLFADQEERGAHAFLGERGEDLLVVVRRGRGMADDTDVAHPEDASLLDRHPMRDDEGQIRPEFVEAITRAIQAADTVFLRGIVAELHEADLGDLIAALEPEQRVNLVELTGSDFDFSALNEVDETVREEILEELEAEEVAEGVRDLESDDAVELLESLDKEDREEVLEKLSPSERDVIERSLEYPENSAGRRM